MRQKVSIILSTTDIFHPPPLPTGADELVLIAEYGAVARNTGATLAKHSILVFMDDRLRLTGSLESISRAPNHEAWWTLHNYEAGSSDPQLVATCRGLSLCGACHLPSGSAQPFQAIRRPLFDFVGGYRDVPDYGRDLAVRLDRAGARVYRSNAVGYLLEEWNPTREPEVRDVTASHRIVPAYVAERAYAATL